MAARAKLAYAELSTPCLSPASVAYRTMVELSSIRDVDSSIPNQNICNGQYSSAAHQWMLHIACKHLLSTPRNVRSCYVFHLCKHLGFAILPSSGVLSNTKPHVSSICLSSRLQGIHIAAAYMADIAFVAPLQSGARHAHRPNLLHLQSKPLGLIGHPSIPQLPPWTFISGTVAKRS